jgi:hypothetical protein
MDGKCVTDPQCASKLVQPQRAAVRIRHPGPLTRFTALVNGGPVLLMTAQFGRSFVRDAAYRLRDRRSALDLRPSWRLFASLADWGARWPADQSTYAAGLILSAAADPAVDRAVGRCLADLAMLGRPLLWGAVGHRVHWQSRFALTPNGWGPEVILPYPGDYARLRAADDAPEFCPLFASILYTEEPDFSVFASSLSWWEPRHFHRVMHDGKVTIFIGSLPDG